MGTSSLPATPFSPSTFGDTPSWPTPASGEPEESEQMSLNQRNMLKASVHTLLWYCSPSVHLTVLLIYIDNLLSGKMMSHLVLMPQYHLFFMPTRNILSSNSSTLTGLRDVNMWPSCGERCPLNRELRILYVFISNSAYSITFSQTH